ncbi:MAG TPA: aminotransferase class III-fold pyridoxal phosphate-dependent enzyme, partial [Chloroflexota bacterium]|nr:aminotransferase class III-fold pyridoxal phosphate-dependent enzyme [Chloroflexota bacterium]
GSLTFGVPTSPGVPAGAAASTLVAPFNDPPALDATFETHGDRIAAVIVEPVAGNMGVVLPAPAFLSAIARHTRAAGALFICDEVISGFRVALGGAQQRYDLSPDLTVLGKIIGGGLPVGAYGGHGEIMERVSPSGSVYQAGTLSGNPVGMAAGLANLAALRDPGFYDRLDRVTEQLANGLRSAAQETGVPVTVQTMTGMLTLFFRADPVRNLDDARASDATRFARFFHAMLRRGVYLPPSQFEAWMLSAAHTPDTIEETMQSARVAFAEVEQASAG